MWAQRVLCARWYRHCSKSDVPPTIYENQAKQKKERMSTERHPFFCCGRPGTVIRPGPAGINGTGKLRRLSSVLLSSRSLGGLALLDRRADRGGHQRRNGQHDEDNGNGMLPDRLGGSQQVNVLRRAFFSAREPRTRPRMIGGMAKSNLIRTKPITPMMSIRKTSSR